MILLSRAAARCRRVGLRSSVLALSALFLLLAAALPASANFIRPFGSLNAGSPEDGLVQAVPPNQLTPTVGTVQFSNAQRGYSATADLGNGELSGRAFVSQSGPGAGQASVNPRFGETVTFQTVGPDTWDFEYTLEGTVTTTGDAFPIYQTFGQNTFKTTFVQMALHIFEGNTIAANGTSPGNGLTDWVTELPNALFSEVINLDFSPGGDQVGDVLDNENLFLSDTISGSLNLDPGSTSFDIVVIFAASGSVPGNLVSGFDFDFSNTASFDIDTAADFSSDSGVFLTGTNIPEPATGLLMVLGLGGLAVRASRRREV